MQPGHKAVGDCAHLQLLSTTKRLFRLVYLFGFRSGCLLSFSLDLLPGKGFGRGGWGVSLVSVCILIWDWDVESEPDQLEWTRTIGRMAPSVPSILSACLFQWHPTFVTFLFWSWSDSCSGCTRKDWRIITIPAAAEGRRWKSKGYIGHSQGRLHYIKYEVDAHDCENCYELSIWVLQDYDRQEWLLKDTVSFLKLSGKKSCTGRMSDFSVVAIHQDCNVVFIIQPWKRLIAYDMDCKEVSVIATFEHESRGAGIAPYVPYFLESQALANKLWKCML